MNVPGREHRGCIMNIDLHRLKAARIAKGVTQLEIATALGWKSRTTYTKREIGTVDIGVDEFLKILEVLNVSSDDAYLFFTPSSKNNS